jgi:putative membrane protein
MKVKLVFVSILIIYTILSQIILNQLNKGTIKLNDLQLRLWNEGATLLLISIISLAVLKTSISWLKAIFIFLLIGMTLMFLIKLYKRLLNK